MTTAYCPLPSLSSMAEDERALLLPITPHFLGSKGISKPTSTNVGYGIPLNFDFDDRSSARFSTPFYMEAKYNRLHVNGLLIFQVPTTSSVYRAYGHLPCFKKIDETNAELVMSSENILICVVEIGATYRLHVKLASRGPRFRILHKEKIRSKNV